MVANFLLRLTWLSLAGVLMHGVDGEILATGGKSYKANFTISLTDILDSKIIESMLDKTYNGRQKYFYSDIFWTETDPEVQLQTEINFYESMLMVSLQIWSLPSKIASGYVAVHSGSLNAHGKKIPYYNTSSYIKTKLCFYAMAFMFYEKQTDNPDPQYRVYFDIDAVIYYRPNTSIEAANLGSDAEKHDLVQRKKPYLASFTVSLDDIVGSSIESMLNGTYSGTETSFRGEILSTKTEPDVQWHFGVEYDKEESSKVQIYFHLSSLPPDVEKVSARLRCQKLDHEGDKLFYYTTPISLITGSFFKGKYMKTDFDIDPQHRINCDVFEAFLIYKSVSVLELLEAKDVVLKVKDVVMEMKGEMMKTRDEMEGTKDQMVKAKDEVLDARDEVLKLKEDFLKMKDVVLKLKETVEYKVLETK